MMERKEILRNQWEYVACRQILTLYFNVNTVKNCEAFPSIFRKTSIGNDDSTISDLAHL